MNTLYTVSCWSCRSHQLKALFSYFTHKIILWDSRDLLDTCMSSTARITSWLQSVSIVICTQMLLILLWVACTDVFCKVFCKYTCLMVTCWISALMLQNINFGTWKSFRLTLGCKRCHSTHICTQSWRRIGMCILPIDIRLHMNLLLWQAGL